MNATIDSYLQMRVLLTEKDVKELEEKGRLTCTIERTPEFDISPLRIYVCEKDFPRKDELEKDFEDNYNWGFEIYISRRRLKLIKSRSMTDAESPRMWLRQACISLDGVF